MDVVTYGLCKNFALKVAAGFQTVTVDEPTSTINFILLDGKTVSLKIPQLRGIDTIYFDTVINPTTSEEETHLFFGMTDGTTEDAGLVPGAKPTLAKSLTATVDIGSVVSGKTYTAGTQLEQIIRDMLIKVEAPVVEISYEPTDKFYDVVTDTIEDIKIKTKVTKKTYDISKIEFYVNNAIVNTLTTNVKDGGNFSYDYHFNTPTNSNINLKVIAYDTKNNKTSINTIIKFVGRSYFGFVAETVIVPSETNIKGLQNSTLKDKSTLTYEDIPLPQDGNLYKVLYGYPKEFGKINKIVDADGRDYTASYTENIVAVDGIDYYTYILTDGTGAAGATQKFS